MFPGFTGHRPRLQLVHGDADQTITYKNEAEAVKEWTNVLGLMTDPTMKVDSGLTLGTHQAKRQQWKDSCGFVALDFLTSVGGDHGPSDALFQGNFVLPFLGLDSQAAVDAALDAQVVQCGAGGSTGGGGAGGGGGAAGGASGSGGAGGNPSSGAGGGIASGGTSGAGVTAGTGATSGAPSAGGSSGGAPGTGGGSTTGVAGALTGSSGAPGGASSGNPPGSNDSSGCGIGTSRPSLPTGIIGLALALLTLRRKRR
jgi:acetylxylan esterase